MPHSNQSQASDSDPEESQDEAPDLDLDPDEAPLGPVEVPGKAEAAEGFEDFDEEDFDDEFDDDFEEELEDEYEMVEDDDFGDDAAIEETGEIVPELEEDIGAAFGEVEDTADPAVAGDDEEEEEAEEFEE